MKKNRCSSGAGKQQLKHCFWCGSWYDYGARMYDAQLGRFHTQDRFAEEYNSLSPYHYTANNPIRFIDVNGDSIDFSKIIEGDKNVANTYKNDLNSKTGLQLSYNDEGGMEYAKDENGKPIVNKDGTSRKARKNLMKAIDNETTVTVDFTSNSPNPDNGNYVPNIGDNIIKTHKTIILTNIIIV